MENYDSEQGPTPERLRHAGEFFTVAGRSRSSRKFTFLDDALGRALVRRTIAPSEYSALRKYALHWLAGGLQGHLNTVDLNRVLAFDPGAMTGLARTERQAEHRRIYQAARACIGHRPAFVADHVACYDSSLADVGVMLGYRSRWHGRATALEILSDAGYRLGIFWDDLAKAA
jgi:hypothetical protein